MKAEPDLQWVPKVSPKVVFYDPTHRRRRIIFGVVFIFLLVSTLWFAEFFLRIDNAPPLPAPASLVATPQDQQSSGAQRATRIIMMREKAVSDCGQFDILPRTQVKQFSGFLPFRDQTALSALRARCNDIEHLFFEAFVFGGADGGAIRPLGPEAGSFPLAEFGETWMGRNKPSSYALVSPVAWADTDDVAALLEDAQRPIFESGVRQLSLADDIKGVCLDLSRHPLIDPSLIRKALEILHDNLPGENRSTCLLAPIDARLWQDPDVILRVDHAVVTLPSVDFGTATTSVSFSDIREQLQQIWRVVPAEKLQLAFGSQGTVLVSGQRRSAPISFAEAMFNTFIYDGVVGYSSEVSALSARYTDASQEFNSVLIPDIAIWLDALAVPLALSTPVIWPLGYEAPSIWNDGAERRSFSNDGWERVNLSSFDVFTGAGPFSTLISPAESRKTTDTTRASDSDQHTTTRSEIPLPNHVNFFGFEPSDFSLSLVIVGLPSTFQTTEWIDLLAALELKVVFFASFRDLLGAEGTVKKLVEAGHQIGVTFQPRTSQSWLSQQTDHLGRHLVQHLLAHRLGLQARFVLAPGAPGRIPDTLPRLEQMRDLQASGLFVVHPSVETDLDDFDSEQFVERVYELALAQSTNVVSFDIRNANNRDALREIPQLLERLRSDGFDFFALHELAGISAKEALPPIEFEATKRDDITYATLSVSWLGIQGIIFLLALIVALRSPIYLVLALVRRKGAGIDPGYHPTVTLIVPAYNEEKVIGRTLQSAIESDYPNLRIIVVDDGSTDNTANVVEKRFHDVANLTLVRQANGGKWSAIDHAIELADSSIICILDADSLIERHAVSHIVQPFKDSRVGAVAGTVEIGNPRNLLTAFQTLEYMYTQQVMRRAYEVFDGIIVVPGAIGAWRTSAVVEAGLVSGDTITEDADLTIAVHRAGYKVRYQEAAKSYTEAPVRIRDFLRQRFRWTFGMIQVSWKHKATVPELRPVGFISMVDAIWYALVTSLIYPIMDFVLVIAVVKLGYFYMTTGSFAGVSLPILTSGAYLLLICVDFLNIFFSMLFAKRFSLKLLVAVPLLRFGYRQLLYISTIRAVFAALLGKSASWNKLDRTGGTHMPT